MADKRLRTKSEVKRFFTNLKGKKITDDMISILIDVLWRNRSNMRTSGFRIAGGLDAVISFDIASRTFTIAPYDPLEPTYSPRFTFYSWSYQADFNERRSAETIQIPDEEGFFAIFYATNETTREQSLHYIKNPTETELTTIYLRKIVISFIYWDAAAGEVIHFGDDRHGSEWNPPVHRFIHDAFHAKRKNGLQLTGMVLAGDGSLNSEAQFTVTGGIMLHDDFELTIPNSTASIPILYSFGSLPRFLSNAGYGIAKGPNRIYFNSGQSSLAECSSGNYCLYHIFATNEILTTSRKSISVMGINQYTTLADVYANVNPELDSVSAYMPQQGACYIGSIIVQTDDTYTNSIKARIVSIVAKEIHPPVTITDASAPFLQIGENQELNYTHWQANYQETDINSPSYIVGKPNLAKAFTDLTDVIPEDYIAKAKHVPIVNDDEDKLDLIATEEIETVIAALTELVDCPPSYTGKGGFILRVRLDETGIEFVAP